MYTDTRTRKKETRRRVVLTGSGRPLPQRCQECWPLLLPWGGHSFQSLMVRGRNEMTVDDTEFLHGIKASYFVSNVGQLKKTERNWGV